MQHSASDETKVRSWFILQNVSLRVLGLVQDKMRWRNKIVGPGRDKIGKTHNRVLGDDVGRGEDVLKATSCAPEASG